MKASSLKDIYFTWAVQMIGRTTYCRVNENSYEVLQLYCAPSALMQRFDDLDETVFDVWSFVLQAIATGAILCVGTCVHSELEWCVTFRFESVPDRVITSLWCTCKRCVLSHIIVYLLWKWNPRSNICFVLFLYMYQWTPRLYQWAELNEVICITSLYAKFVSIYYICTSWHLSM